MLIVNGAGSVLAKGFIEACKDSPVVAISRESRISGTKVRNINLNSQSELEIFLLSLPDERYTWINFQAIRTNDLLINSTTIDLEKSFEINFGKNYIAARVLLPKMIRAKGGGFIFIGSVKADLGDRGAAVYSATKAACDSLMKSIVKEYSRFNITCNTLSIGYAQTPMWFSLEPEVRKRLMSEVPGKKIVDQEEINASLKLLLDCRSINGLKLRLDGGLGVGS